MAIAPSNWRKGEEIRDQVSTRRQRIGRWRNSDAVIRLVGTACAAEDSLRLYDGKRHSVL
jgi:hypothetical protein